MNCKWVWCLMGALAFGLAGCATHNEGQGGYNNAGYQQQTGYYQTNYNDGWNNPGPPYEWQHPSPRPQMTP